MIEGGGGHGCGYPSPGFLVTDRSLDSFAMQAGKQVRAGGGNSQLDGHGFFSHKIRDSIDQFDHSGTGLHGDHDGIGKMVAQIGKGGRIFNLVDLIEDHEHLLCIGAQFPRTCMVVL